MNIIKNSHKIGLTANNLRSKPNITNQLKVAKYYNQMMISSSTLYKTIILSEKNFHKLDQFLIFIIKKLGVI